MIKKIMAVMLLCITPFLLFAQYKNNKWLLGDEFTPPWGGTKIEFNSSNRTISYDPRSMWLNDCFSGLSDKDENWFVYTNGKTICNKSHDTLVNGFGLGPGADNYWEIRGLAGPSEAIFFPGDSINNKIYLFHENTELYSATHPLGNQPHSLQLYYSIIDPLAAGGKGEVISKNNLILDDTLEVSNVLAVRHANGRDWWVVVKRFYVDLFYAILVTPDSVYAPISYTSQSPVQVVGGQACFSPNGEHYASFSASSRLRIYDMDRCTGILSNYRGKFISYNIAGATSFSPNSRFLYINTIDTLWQFDMEAPDVLASQTFIASYDGYTDSVGYATIFIWHWLAPDGKIYITSNQLSRKFHVITNPDMPGQACNFQQHSVSIPTYNNDTSPTSINLALYQQSGSPCDTLGVGVPSLTLPKEERIKVLSNPSNGRFSIEYIPQRVSGFLYVYDVNGALVYTEYVSPFTSIKNLDLSQKLSNGMYAVSLVFGKATSTEKIIIQKQ